MSKFTKGPWVVDFDGRYYNVISEDCGEIIGCEGFYSEHERDKANSALCAAAPDLYEALESAVMAANADVIKVRPSDREAFLGMLESWNNALAKARGEYEA